jgi:preprotein translocase subunit SecF
LIRVPSRPDIDQATLGDQIQALLREAEPEMEVRRSEFVGPAVGAELRETAGLAMLVALGAVMLYIMFRFTGKFSIGAVTALIHDVIITLGMFAIFRWTFDLAVLAAVLAVIGYSLNDTIVVSDRIRENFRKVRRGGATEIINRSLNQTLGRTVVTSLTTLMVLLALQIFGGEMIHGFAIALIIGVIVGTYSSIYVASSMLMVLGISREDLMVPEKEGVRDDVP